MELDVRISDVTIAGVAFDVHRVGEAGLRGWVLLTAAELPTSVADGYVDADFVDLVRGLGSSSEFGTISRWALLAPEFGWPLAAGSCGCVADGGLSDMARALNGTSLFRVPGTVFDHLLIRADLFAGAVGADEDENFVSGARWLTSVGLETSWVAAGHVDATPRSTLLRDGLACVDAAWLHDSFVRALDAYVNGGIANARANALRRAFVQRVRDDNGYTYGAAPEPGVVRRELFVLNSVRMTESICCTTVEHGGRPVFGTEMERLVHPTNGEPEATPSMSTSSMDQR